MDLTQESQESEPNVESIKPPEEDEKEEKALKEEASNRGGKKVAAGRGDVLPRTGSKTSSKTSIEMSSQGERGKGKGREGSGVAGPDRNASEARRDAAGSCNNAKRGGGAGTERGRGGRPVSEAPRVVGDSGQKEARDSAGVTAPSDDVFPKIPKLGEKMLEPSAASQQAPKVVLNWRPGQDVEKTEQGGQLGRWLEEAISRKGTVHRRSRTCTCALTQHAHTHIGLSFDSV
jgi:hypothetical protein